MTRDKKITGLALKVGPLGENDRLLTVLSYEEGIIRIAIPGARRPKSRLAATSPLTFLELQVGGKGSLLKARQIKILKSFSMLGEQLETLATAQSLSELSILLVGTNDPQPEILEAILIHLERLQKKDIAPLEVLANCVQSCIHLLALGGYGLPIHTCCKSGQDLIPPIGNWEWSCTLIANEGFAIGTIINEGIILNASELALLQRLVNAPLPLKKNGELLGPFSVWIKLLKVVEIWIGAHLNKKLNALTMLKATLT
ncbi:MULTISPECIES: DNA repair protein RecO [unclassified Prochlorococcus]|uniref:DNA repair protein RecO n=1 Tax=unclassified Prochlorococcus TaxID=2627481 RepID=UPI0005339581|nr:MULTISPECIES: DNA repair protein RecO [unclassified Prochlorococcus]KGG16566.1 DNA recombination and repair protein RecO [Prochlorococcus sp. MIT 0602]KGG16959.1 DNA recombination and repair protein RecO [Prochlorococcus sp. MIT 0603]